MDDAGPMSVASGSPVVPPRTTSWKCSVPPVGSAKLDPGEPRSWRRSSAVQRELAGQQLIRAPVVSKTAHCPSAAAATSASTARSDPPDRAALAHKSASSHD